MFSNLTYKQKFYAVIGGFILLSLAGYKKTFKQVFALKSELTVVKQQLGSANNSINSMYGLKNDIAMLDAMIGGNTSNPNQVQRMLLDFISKNQVEVNLVSIEDVHLFSNEEFLIHTNQLELEGSYENLIALLYDIEKNFNSSRIVSNSIYSKKNYRTNTTKLYLKIILQNYEKV